MLPNIHRSFSVKLGALSLCVWVFWSMPTRVLLPPPLAACPPFCGLLLWSWWVCGLLLWSWWGGCNKRSFSRLIPPLLSPSSSLLRESGEPSSPPFPWVCNCVCMCVCVCAATSTRSARDLKSMFLSKFWCQTTELNCSRLMHTELMHKAEAHTIGHR